MCNLFLSSALIDNISRKIYLQQEKPGLYVVATPIGNIFDISLRALYILKKVKLIFAEDTRNSKKLLNFFEINTPLIACHEYNEILSQVTNKIHKGESYALISDAGTPTISDPGYRLVNWCIQHGIDVFPIPGACAFIAGLSASGMPTDSFTFFGFLPVKEQARLKFLQDIKNNEETLIFLESPNRILNTLNNMLTILGNRFCCICREITKVFEEFIRGDFDEIIHLLEGEKIQGEFVIIVRGRKTNKNDNIIVAISELANLLNKYSLKEAVSMTSKKYQINKNIIYQKALELKNE